jgi:DNA polymerase-3 subunit epsilon
MTPGIKFALALAGACGLVLGLVVAAAAGLWADFSAEERAVIGHIVGERTGLLVTAAFFLPFALGLLLKWLFDLYVFAPRRLAEEIRVITTVNPGHRVHPIGAQELQELAAIINNFADTYQAAKSDIEGKIREAKAGLEEEKNRLAALMSELTQGVLVCNVEGVMLLYNHRAKQLLSQSSEHRRNIGASSPVGLGRTIFSIIERNLIVHSLENIQSRLDAGHSTPVAAFLSTTASGQLLRMQMAPVLGTVEEPTAATGPEEATENAAAERERNTTRITGFILTLEDVTKAVETGSRRDVLLQSLTEGSRAALGSIRAAVETMLTYPDMEPERQRAFVNIIDEETRKVSAKLDQTVREYADSLKTQWPLEEMAGTDLIQIVRRRIETKLNLETAADAMDERLWLKVDSYWLTQAITGLAERLAAMLNVREFRFRLSRAGRLAHIDLVWAGSPVTAETLQDWENQPVGIGGETAPLTLKDVIERHDAEAWCQSDLASRTACVRLALPVADEPAKSLPLFRDIGADRPEYYDFDLFRQTGQTAELDRRLLSELSYTVFDTETTGLQPSEGDEIISIGAVRIVNGRLLQHEAFEQLIDPRRPLSKESAKIHGIQPSMLEGQPPIEAVLPEFHRFCEGTVLVAHNAAFDMRFLQVKEARTAVKFTQPVLDTLLLSAVLHPNINAHRMEAIAQRFGISVIGRHTAMGDAIVASEVFLKMIPLLAEHGILTLRDAREASQKTYYARVQY